VASDAVGGFAVAYQGWGPANQNIKVAAFDPSGQSVGTMEATVTPSGLNSSPAITMTPSGNFILVYQGPAGAASGIFFRRFQVDNSAVAAVLSAVDAAEVPVSSTLVNTSYAPAIASDQAGNFVLVWAAASSATVSTAAIYAQRFSSAGLPMAAIFKVNSSSGPKENPTLAMSPNGDFVVAWEASDGNNFGVYERRYDASGNALDAADVRVNTITAGLQGFPSAAKLVNGDYVITFQGVDASNSGIYKRKFHADGSAYDAADVLVNSDQAGAQMRSAAI